MMDSRSLKPVANQCARRRDHKWEELGGFVLAVLSRRHVTFGGCFKSVKVASLSADSSNQKKHGEQSSLHFFHHTYASTAAPTIKALREMFGMYSVLRHIAVVLA